MPILIVDKDPSALKKLEGVIRNAGYPDVVSAMTLKEAIAKVDKADDALYRAKRSGRNRVVCWDESIANESLK